MKLIPDAEMPDTKAIEEAVLFQLLRGKKKGIAANKAGYWRIEGQDQSGSYHTSRTPTLGYVKGTFRQAVEVAVRTKNFYYWGWGGSGGEIEEIEVVDLKDCTWDFITHNPRIPATDGA